MAGSGAWLHGLAARGPASGLLPAGCWSAPWLLVRPSTARVPPSLQVVLEPGQRRLDALPLPGREALMGLAAAFLPYYCSREVGGWLGRVGGGWVAGPGGWWVAGLVGGWVAGPSCTSLPLQALCRDASPPLLPALSFFLLCSPRSCWCTWASSRRRTTRWRRGGTPLARAPTLPLTESQVGPRRAGAAGGLPLCVCARRGCRLPAPARPVARSRCRHGRPCSQPCCPANPMRALAIPAATLCRRAQQGDSHGARPAALPAHAACAAGAPAPGAAQHRDACAAAGARPASRPAGRPRRPVVEAWRWLRVAGPGRARCPTPALLPLPPVQGELYLLAQAGGPRYAPRRVNRLAQEALDALFPAGRCGAVVVRRGGVGNHAPGRQEGMAGPCCSCRPASRPQPLLQPLQSPSAPALPCLPAPRRPIPQAHAAAHQLCLSLAAPTRGKGGWGSAAAGQRVQPAVACPPHPIREWRDGVGVPASGLTSALLHPLFCSGRGIGWMQSPACATPRRPRCWRRGRRWLRHARACGRRRRRAARGGRSGSVRRCRSDGGGSGRRLDEACCSQLACCRL